MHLNINMLYRAGAGVIVNVIVHAEHVSKQ